MDTPRVSDTSLAAIMEKDKSFAATLWLPIGLDLQDARLEIERLKRQIGEMQQASNPSDQRWGKW